MTVGDERDQPYYGKARIRLATLLIGTACALVLIDSVSDRYEVSLGVLGLLVGTAGVFLGVEILKAVAARQ